jgi:hypothetical protein
VFKTADFTSWRSRCARVSGESRWIPGLRARCPCR